MSKKEIKVKVVNNEPVLNDVEKGMVISTYLRHLAEAGIETFYILPDCASENKLRRISLFTSSVVMVKNENDNTLAITHNRYGHAGVKIAKESFDNLFKNEMERRYFSPKGKLLAYFGEPPEEGMKYIVVELTGKWYTFYEIHSDGSVHKSPLATDTMTIRYCDDKWDPNDLINFIDEHEDEYYIPDLSMELFIGRWELEVNETY